MNRNYSAFSLLVVLAFLFQGANGQPATRQISVNLQQESGPLNTFFKECIGAGRANEGLRADWQQQLKTVKADCGFQYIRMHGLLTDDMAVYAEDRDGTPIYNYQYIDALYDYILEIGMKPFVEFGFMPNALASGPQTIFWWRGNVTPPKDYNKWEDLIRNLVQHWTDRYGVDEVMNWYFEVWNEPNLTPGFWTGTQDEYFKLYDYAVRGVKAVNPNYRVGGPATAGAAWVPETIDFCKKNDVPIDFISTHSYGVDAGFLDEFGGTGTRLSTNERAVSQDVLQSRRQISESGRPDLELHYTEWSSSYTPADPIHDSYHEAAYILNKLKQVGDAANSMSYWVFTDIFEEPGPRYTPFHGGFGLMTIQGIKKSAYHAYSFLNKLGETELANTDEQSWACKDAEGNVQLLLWDYSYTLPDDSINNQQYYKQDLPAKSKGVAKVDLRGMEPGDYQLEVYQVGYLANDPYTHYLQMGEPSQLNRAQVADLKSKSAGEPVSVETISLGADGRFSRSLPLRENDVFLLRILKQ